MNDDFLYQRTSQPFYPQVGCQWLPVIQLTDELGRNKQLITKQNYREFIERIVDPLLPDAYQFDIMRGLYMVDYPNYSSSFSVNGYATKGQIFVLEKFQTKINKSNGLSVTYWSLEENPIADEFVDIMAYHYA